MSSSSPKPRWSARMGSVMRRTSSVLTISRPSSTASERDTDNASLSSNTKGREPSTLSSPSLPIVVTPSSPIAESPLREVTPESQESVGLSPLITSSEIVPSTLSPSVEESQDPTGYIPPVIDSTAGNPGAFTDEPWELPQPDVAQDPYGFGPVEPHFEPATLNTPEPADPETIITEALVDEPIPYSVEPMEESIKDFEPVDYADNTAEFSEAVHGNANVISHDPFADPIAPRITQPILDMPETEFADNYHQGPTETHSHSPVVIPLPSFVDVIGSIPSMSNLKNDTVNLVETRETLPLLSRPARLSKHIPSSYLQLCPRDLVSISPPVYSASQSTTSSGNTNSCHPHPATPPRIHMLHTLGWLEYHLPDGTVYYVHPTNRVTTEINLRSERMLTDVERFMADYSNDQSGSAMEGTVTSGGEIWLKDVGTAKSGLVLEAWWVDHQMRTVMIGGDEKEHARKGKAKKGGTVFSEEDLLDDTEHRYWSFMEAHPAHNSLPAKAKMEAIDVLTWAWTEHLFPSHRGIPAPFTREECQELMTLIRSFGDDHDDGIQTRIVSRVLLEVACWRQSCFRPKKPRPTNIGSESSHSSLPISSRQLFKWFIIDFFISCLLLCISYISIEHTCLSKRTVDEESGLRYATATLVIGAYTCLVAWTLFRGLLAWWLSSLPRSRWERRSGSLLRAQN